MTAVAPPPAARVEPWPGPTAPRPLRPAPLWVWPVVAVLAVAAALAGVWLDRLWPGLPTLANPDTLHLARLNPVARQAGVATAPLRVVALGDSKLRFAVNFDATLRGDAGPGAVAPPGDAAPSAVEPRGDAEPSAVASPGDAVPSAPMPPIHFVRIHWNNATLADLAPALQALQQHPPALLLVQRDLLLTLRGADPAERTWHARWAANLQRLRLALGWPGRQAGLENRGATTWQPAVVRPGSPAAAAYHQRVQRQQPKPDAARAAWLAWLRTLRSRGTQVVLLDIPRAPWAQALQPAGLLAQEARITAQLAAHHGLAVWAAAPLSDDAFYDSGHMLPAGQHAHSRWLWRQLLAWQALAGQTRAGQTQAGQTQAGQAHRPVATPP